MRSIEEFKDNYDDEHLSDEIRFQMVWHKKLIAKLLSGRVTKDEQDETKYKDFDAETNEDLFIKHNDIVEEDRDTDTDRESGENSEWKGK